MHHLTHHSPIITAGNRRLGLKCTGQFPRRHGYMRETPGAKNAACSGLDGQEYQMIVFLLKPLVIEPNLQLILGP
jgi:hypothetical protein